MTKRLDYFDFLRGVAIIMVVGIHVYTIPETWESMSDLLGVIMRQMLNCAVPIFLAISGFFLGKKILNTKEECFFFWKKQILRVYLPCLIWSIPYFLQAVFNGDNILKELLILLSCGYSIYYFIALIIQCYLLLPKFQNIDWGGQIVCACITMASTILIAYCGFNKLPLLLYAGPITTWIVYFTFGVYLSKHGRNYSIKVIGIVALFSFLIQIQECYYLSHNLSGGYGIKPSSCLFSMSIILLLFSTKIEKLYRDDSLFLRFIKYIGTISFGIYLIHFLVIIVLNKFNTESVWLVKWCITLLLSIIVITIGQKLLPIKINRYLGFI